jgi:hypothetical protein
MSGVATERRKKASTPKPHPGRPRVGSTSTDATVQARLVPEMKSAFEELARRNGTTESDMLRQAVRELLLKNDLWPPKGAPSH